MRVLHVYRTYFPDTQGGLEEVIRQICANTIPQGVKNRVLSLSANPDPAVVYRSEAEVHRFSLTAEVASCGMSLNALAGFRALAGWADVINYHFPWPFADVLHLLGGVKKPTVITYHSDIVRQRLLMRVYRPLMRYFLGSADRIVATSPNYADSSEILQGYRDKLSVIPLGLSEATSVACPEQLLERMRQRFGDSFFFFIGVLRYYKGIHILLDALKGSDIPVVIAGDGPMRRALEAQAQANGLSRVHFLGRVTDQEKTALMQLCRGVVFPSHLRSEAFGVTLLEGAMHAKPLISTEIGTGTSYVNKHGETGYTPAGGDALALFQAMDRLYRDPAQAQQMGAAARLRYERLFTGERMGQSYARLYGELLEAKAPSPLGGRR